MISPEGLRGDGRRANDLRRTITSLNSVAGADGSCLLAVGNTRVLVSVLGPRESKRHGLHVAVGKIQGRDGGDLQAIIESTFEKIIFPQESEISVQVQILANDGSLLATVCNAVSLALIDAGIEMKDSLVAVTASVSNKCSMLDLNYSEESMDLPVFTVGFLPRTGNLALTHLEGRLPSDCLSDLIDIGKLGCDLLHGQFDEIIRNNIA